MQRKLSLKEAATLMGLSVSGVRARAKKEPDKYGLSRDNTGRLFLTVDPASLQTAPALKPANESASEPSAATLRALLHEVREDRDRWRALAETLAARRRWRWPF